MRMCFTAAARTLARRKQRLNMDQCASVANPVHEWSLHVEAVRTHTRRHGRTVNCNMCALLLCAREQKIKYQTKPGTKKKQMYDRKCNMVFGWWIRPSTGISLGPLVVGNSFGDANVQRAERNVIIIIMSIPLSFDVRFNNVALCTNSFVALNIYLLLVWRWNTVLWNSITRIKELSVKCIWLQILQATLLNRLRLCGSLTDLSSDNHCHGDNQTTSVSLFVRFIVVRRKLICHSFVWLYE